MPFQREGRRQREKAMMICKCKNRLTKREKTTWKRQVVKLSWM